MREPPKLSSHPELISTLREITFKQFHDWRVGLEQAARSENADEVAISDLIRNPTIHYWYVLLEMYVRQRLNLASLTKEESHRMFPTLSEQVGRAYVDRLVRASLIRTVRKGRSYNVESSVGASALVTSNIDRWSARFGELHEELLKADRCAELVNTGN